MKNEKKSLLEHQLQLDPRPNLLDFGWASGWYTSTCYICKTLFLGDKRAVTCADCAYKELETGENNK